MSVNVDKFKRLDIILLCGLYGSGKTKFANMHFKGTGRFRISRSEIRKLMFEMTNFNENWTPENFTEDDDVLIKHVERKISEHYLHNMRKVLIINTFMTKNSRSRFVKLAKETKKTVGAIFLDAPLEKCRAENQKEAAKAPEIVLNTLHSKKELPSVSEGFNEVLVVDNF